MQSTAAKRYAQALFDLAQAKNLDLNSQVAALPLVWNQHDFRHVLADPRVSRSEKRQLLSAVSEQLRLHPFVENTLNLMLDKGRVDQVQVLSTHYQELDDHHRGRIRARCQAVSLLTHEQQQLLKDKLSKLTGAKEVELSIETEPALLAGFVIHLGGKIIDGSLRGRLQRLGRRMAQPSHGS